MLRMMPEGNQTWWVRQYDSAVCGLEQLYGPDIRNDDGPTSVQHTVLLAPT